MANLTEAFGNALKLFGFQIGKPDNTVPSGQQKYDTFAQPQNDDGAVVLTAGGTFGHYVDMEGVARNEAALITKYLEMSLQPECEGAIDQIINEAIVSERHESPVKINTDKLKKYSDDFKDILKGEFDEILDLLNFSHQGYKIFKKWYIMGRLYYHIMVDSEHPELGIQELRFIDPRRIRKVREIKKKINPNGIEVVDTINEYYIYSERGLHNTASTSIMGIRIAVDAIAYINSGVTDGTPSNMVLSRLHKAIKPLNQLRMMEDAVVIYRISRAPERRIFYIDVGHLPNAQAEEYINGLILKYRNKMLYDATTGEIKDDKRFQSMMDDFWLPRREGTKGTEIDTLAGGQTLGQIEDVDYFQQRLYKSLNIPISRLESNTGFNLGRSAEISRDETNFIKFITQLQTEFEHIFDILLQTQLLLKGIIVKDDWDYIRRNLVYEFQQNSFYIELKEQELLTTRITALTQAAPFAGVYFSYEQLMRDILKYDDDKIKEVLGQIEIEKGQVRVPFDQLAGVVAQEQMMDYQMDQQGQAEMQQAGMEQDNLNLQHKLDVRAQRDAARNDIELKKIENRGTHQQLTKQIALKQADTKLQVAKIRAAAFIKAKKKT